VKRQKKKVPIEVESADDEKSTKTKKTTRKAVKKQ
jgi:hypothetical protein